MKIAEYSDNCLEADMSFLVAQFDQYSEEWSAQRFAASKESTDCSRCKTF